jgi:hypothetical protein
MQNGKGSKPRPIKSVEDFNKNWDDIDWGKKSKNNGKKSVDKS